MEPILFIYTALKKRLGFKFNFFVKGRVGPEGIQGDAGTRGDKVCKQLLRLLKMVHLSTVRQDLSSKLSF